uniref:HTH luxR-type domain-containing protein n=1 Tax=Streptomyces sp. NBC_00049 TaxID=2903617 RepID=A0AAU2K1I2_9ACTN
MSEHAPSLVGMAMSASTTAALSASDTESTGAPEAVRWQVGFSGAELNVLRLISEGQTIAGAAKVLSIKHRAASLHLADAYARAFGSRMGAGYATVRTQLLALLDFAFTCGALPPPPGGTPALGELPRRILRLVVDGVPTGEQPARLGRPPAEVAAATKRLREEAGLGPHEAWNRVVAWGHANRLLTPITSTPVAQEPADTAPSNQPLCTGRAR